MNRNYNIYQTPDGKYVTKDIMTNLTNPHQFDTAEEAARDADLFYEKLDAEW